MKTLLRYLAPNPGNSMFSGLERFKWFRKLYGGRWYLLSCSGVMTGWSHGSDLAPFFDTHRTEDWDCSGIMKYL